MRAKFFERQIEGGRYFTYMGKFFPAAVLFTPSSCLGYGGAWLRKLSNMDGERVSMPHSLLAQGLHNGLL